MSAGHSRETLLIGRFMLKSYISSNHIRWNLCFFKIQFLAWHSTKAQKHKNYLVRGRKRSHFVWVVAVNTFQQNYLVVSQLQMLKHSLKQWSLAWQPSRVMPRTSNPPPDIKISSYTCYVNRMYKPQYGSYVTDKSERILRLQEYKNALIFTPVTVYGVRTVKILNTNE